MTCVAETSADETVARKERAVAALARLGALGRQLGPSSWEITLASDQVSTGQVRFDDGVIRLAAPVVGPQWPPDRLWEILNRNGLAGPGVRLGLSQGRRILLIGEIVLENVCEIESRIGRLLANMTQLDRTWNEDSAGPADPAALCQEAGWEFTCRDNAVVVRLEANRRGMGMQAAAIPFSALINAHGGVLRCVVELAGDDAPPPEPNRAAVAELLIRVAAQIRLARPAATAVDGRNALIFESLLLSSASACEFGKALSALSVAVQLCGPEAAALYRDADLAREFLRIRFPDLVGPGVS